MLRSSQLHGLNALVPSPVNIVPQSNANSASASTVFTFTSQAIGAAVPGRIIAVAIYAIALAGSAQLVSATIGGVAATILKQQMNSAVGVDNLTAIIAAPFPTGTTATVVLTFNISHPRCNIATYSIVNGSMIPHSTYADTNATDPVPDMTINAPMGGGHIAVVGSYNGVGSTTYTWANLTEAFDVPFTESFSSAYQNFPVGAASLNVSATPAAGTITRQSMCGVSFSPL